jgi:hypothetical protein
MRVGRREAALANFEASFFKCGWLLKSGCGQAAIAAFSVTLRRSFTLEKETPEHVQRIL